jgi:hypothetical protein
LCTAWLICALVVTANIVTANNAQAEEQGAKPRSPHLLVQAGGYASLGGPASWGTTFAMDLLPGSFAGRYGLRAEWRGYKQKVSEGTAIAGLIFEAGAARPQLALKLLAEVGLTNIREGKRRPLAGGGLEASMWVWGPIGVSVVTDAHIIVDGAQTRPALAGLISLHLGR